MNITLLVYKKTEKLQFLIKNQAKLFERDRSGRVMDKNPTAVATKITPATTKQPTVIGK